MIDSIPVLRMLIFKTGIPLGMGVLLFGLRYWLIRTAWVRRSGFYCERGFKMLQLALAGIVGVLLSLYPLWIGLPKKPSLSVLMMDDLLNLGLLLTYCIFSLLQSYRLVRKLRLFHSSFPTYLIQTSFYWMIFVNVLVFLRLNGGYLPWLNRFFSGSMAPFWLKVLLNGLFLSGLGLAFKVRVLGMGDVDSSLNALVRETAAVFGVGVSRVKLWRLEGIRNAFAAGLWKRGIFLTETLVRTASFQDLKMIIGHECAHFKCYHLEVRVLTAGVSLILGSWLMQLFPDGHWSWWLSYGLLALFLFLAVIRHQEFQADRLAAIYLDGGSSMADALIRTFGLQPIPSGWRRMFTCLSTHPPLRARVRQLRNMD